MKIIRDIGRGLYNLFIGTLIVALVAGGVALATNYTMTQGSGTTFGSLVVSAVNYAQQLICDPTTPTQCLAVSSGGAAKVDASATTQPVSSTTLATKANQDTNSATTAHTCTTAGTSIIGCLGQVDDDVKSVGTIQGNINVGPTSCSLQVATGNTAQNIITASATIHGFTIANIDTSAGSGEPIWINLVGTAAASTVDSFPLAAPTASTFAGLSSYTTPLGFGSSHAVSVIAATSGHKVSCVFW